MSLYIKPRLSPRLIIVPESDGDELIIQNLHNQLRDWEDEPASMSYEAIIDTTGKDDLGGGTKVGLTARLLNARLAFEPRTSSVCSGISTGNSSTILTDSSANFISDGVQPGATIINLTDKSVSTVITVNSETRLTHWPLADGVTNTWSNGDEYKIWNVVQCKVSGGNLTAVNNNGNPMTAIFPTAFTQLLLTSSSSATLQELDMIQYSSFNGGVTVDVTSPYSGTKFPVGTLQQPVNNLLDAVEIALDRGFDTFYIRGNLVINSQAGDYSGFVFIGESMSKTNITIQPDANVENCEFENSNISGTLDGNCKVYQCKIGNLNYIYGVIESCLLQGTIKLGGNETAHFLDCWSGIVEGSAPTIDLGGAGQPLSLRNYNGGIRLVNKTGPERVSIDLNSGDVILDTTVTNGTIIVRGVGYVTDNSNGATVLTDNLVNPYTVANQVWGEDLEGHRVSGSFGEAVGLILGLSQNNYRIKDQVYTSVAGRQLLLSATIRVYNTASDCDNDVNPMGEWKLAASYDNEGNCTAYNVVRI